MRTFPLILAILASSSLVGCNNDQRFVIPEFEGQYDASAHRHTVQDVIGRYNARCQSLATFSAQVTCEMTWNDAPPGHPVHFRKESSDGGRLLFRAPLDTTLTIEKLGNWYLWAGSNHEQYWLFDRTQQPSSLRYGRHDGPGAVRGLGLPVSIQELPLLLGLKPLDPRAEWTLQWFVPVNEKIPPGLVLSRPGLRLFLDENTLAPRRVDLLGIRGEPLLTSELSMLRTPVEDAAQDPQDWPFLPKFATLYPAAKTEAERVKIALEIISASSESKPQAFDLERLKKALCPETTVDLDTAGHEGRIK